MTIMTRLFFFFNDTATTEIYTLSLHDALPIYPMGTTLVAAVLRGKYATIASVGDSRAYLVRANALTQITKDHSLVEEEVARDRKSTRLNSSHANISYAVFCLKKKNTY